MQQNALKFMEQCFAGALTQYGIAKEQKVTGKE